MVITNELVNKCITIMHKNIEAYTKYVSIDISNNSLLQKECIYNYTNDIDYAIKMSKFVHFESKYFTLYTFNYTKEILDILRTIQVTSTECASDGKNCTNINFIDLTIDRDRENNTISLVMESGIACMGFVNSIRGNILRIITEITCTAVYSIPNYELIFDIVVLGNEQYPDTSIKFCDEMTDSITLLQQNNNTDTYMKDRNIVTKFEVYESIVNEEIIYITTLNAIKDKVYEVIPDIESLFKLKLTINEHPTKLILEAIND